MEAVANTRLLGIVRISWATLLFARPTSVIVHLGGTDERASRTVLRLLGARHLVQGLVEMLLAKEFGSTIDILHAMSGLGLGVVDRRWRQPALIDAVIASGFAIAEHRLAS